MLYMVEAHCRRLAAWAACRAASVNGCRLSESRSVDLREASGIIANFGVMTLPAGESIWKVEEHWEGYR